MEVSVFNNGIIGGNGIENDGSVGKGVSCLEKSRLFSAGIIMAVSKDSMAGRLYQNQINEFLPLSPVLYIESSLFGMDRAFRT